MGPDPIDQTNPPPTRVDGRSDKRAFQVRFLGSAARGSTVGEERPAHDGERADAEGLLRVLEDEEALVACRAAPESSGDGARLELRLPLLLATASLPPGSRRVVCVALPSPRELECLAGMEVAPGQAHSRFRGVPQHPAGQSRFAFKCRSGSDARRLLDSLSLAGCTVQGCSERYHLLKEVGHGSFGRVFVAEDSWTGDTVAVKVFDRRPSAPSAAGHPLREAAMLRWCSDISLFPKFKSVQLLVQPQPEAEASTEGGGATRFAIVTELVDGVELFDVLRRGPLSEACAKLVMRRIFSGIGELNRRGVMHRDIKPENVMVTRSEVKLVDFGIACFEWDLEAASDKVGSAGYVAPEVLTRLSQAQTTKVDCFGAGALLFACLNGSGPFSSGSDAEVLSRNAQCRARFDAFAAMPRGARSLIAQLLRSSPGERPTACECLEHPWILECPSRHPRGSLGGPAAIKLARISESQSETDGDDAESVEELWPQQLTSADSSCSTSAPANGVSGRARAEPGKEKGIARRAPAPPSAPEGAWATAGAEASEPSGASGSTGFSAVRALRRSRNRDCSMANGGEEGASEAMGQAGAHACQAKQAVDPAPPDDRRTSKAPAGSVGSALPHIGRRSRRGSPGGEVRPPPSSSAPSECSSGRDGASRESTEKPASSVGGAYSSEGTPKPTSSDAEASGQGTPRATSSDEGPSFPRLASRLASLGAATARAMSSGRRGRSAIAQERSERDFHQLVPKQR